MLSRYETALLTLWHSRRGQGAAVRARKSRLHERVNISLTLHIALLVRCLCHVSNISRYASVDV